MKRSQKRAARSQKPKVRKAAKTKAAAKKDGVAAQTLFEQGIGLAAQGFLFDAIGKFKRAAEADPKNALADDAFYNAGVCYFQLKLFHEALEYFTRVIQGYPKATIAATPGVEEVGRTAAKAHLGRLRCHLALGRREEAQKELDELNKYPDSYVVDGEGKRLTFYELGLQSLKTQSLSR